MASNSKNVVIAGAGCAGLAAGIALQKRGYDVTIFERSSRVGGLAGGTEIAGNTYEYGPHIFHTTDSEVLGDVKRIAGHVLLPFERTIKIKFLGKYFTFPLSMMDLLTKLPLTTTISAVFSLVMHVIRGWFAGKASLTDSERVLKRYYGDVLYRIFFKDYITKVWGYEPREMAPSFAQQRIPRFDVLEWLDKLKRVVLRSSTEVSTEGYVEKVEGEFFTTEKGFSAICEAFADEFERLGGTLHKSESVLRVDVEEERCTTVHTDHRTADCDHFVSTVPINLLPGLLHPAPDPSFQTAASALEFRAICFVGLLINRKTVLPASFMYFRDKSFNRISDLAQFEFVTRPPGSTILSAEITCQPGDPAWEDEAATTATVIDELIAEGLIQASDVLESHVYKVEHGYPIYTVGYEERLRKVLELTDRHANLHSIGRQGRFAYINTHIAMKMGYDLARKIAGDG